MRRAVAAAALGVAALAATAAGLDRLHPLDLGRYHDVSRELVDADGRLLRVSGAGDGILRLATAPADVDPRYLRMLIAYEDRRFRWHPGVDPLAVARATGQWLVHGRVVSGASTLTMQVARLLEPRPRTLGAKVIESLRALQLEWHHSKDDILGMYLTLAPFGGNLEGARAAALAWFGKEPARLTDAEAALLVALPQAPARVRPDRHPAAALAARDKVLNRILPAEAAHLAQLDAVPAARQALPFLAPHLADRLWRAVPEARVPTTLRADLQRRMEDQARHHQRREGGRAGVALLVAERTERGFAVRAYVGSGDYLDTARQGAVDMVRAVRSPGSALKPFIYGLAFDLGLAHPATLVADADTDFGGYRPGNFSGVFMGDVTVTEALRESLNVPAVAVLDAVGPARWVHRLRGAGVTLDLPGGAAPGLAVAVGGLGLTLEDLVALYTALAGDGSLRRPVLRPAEAHRVSPVLAPHAAQAVAAILEGAAPPPGRPSGGRLIAAKTGTSFGYRDAWAVGFDGRHVVGVWVGRPDGTARPQRTGRDAALPLLHAAFDGLPEVPLPRPEAFALLAAEPPPALRRLGPAPDSPRAAGRLAVTYPPDDAILSLSRGDRFRALPLQATGGVPPFLWLVNGAPVARPLWQPDGPGAVDLRVVDATGASAAVRAWVE